MYTLQVDNAVAPRTILPMCVCVCVCVSGRVCVRVCSYCSLTLHSRYTKYPQYVYVKERQSERQTTV